MLYEYTQMEQFCSLTHRQILLSVQTGRHDFSSVTKAWFCCHRSKTSLPLLIFLEDHETALYKTDSSIAMGRMTYVSYCFTLIGRFFFSHNDLFPNFVRCKLFCQDHLSGCSRALHSVLVITYDISHLSLLS